MLSQYLAGSRRTDSKTLIGQIPHITVVKTHLSTLDLSVDSTHTVPAYVETPGPLRPRMLVPGPDGEIWGEVLVWVTAGFLSGMALAWWNDDVPWGWERVRVTAYEWDVLPGS